MRESRRAAHKDAAGRGRVIGKGTGMERAAIARETGTGSKLSQARRFLPAVSNSVSELAKSGPRAIVRELSKPLTTNAFKGRGVLWELRRVDGELARTEEMMRELVSITSEVPAWELSCRLLSFKDGRRMLRWRIRGQKSYLRDKEAQAIFEAYPEPKRSWYLNALEQAKDLATRHRHDMTRRRILQGKLPTAPVYAREPVRGFLPLPVQKRYEALTVAMA